MSKESKSKVEEELSDKNETITDNSSEMKEENGNPDAKPEDTDLIQIEKLKNEIGNANDKYIRLLSEFENYKRRTAKERIDLIKSSTKDLVVELLSVLDDFERGLDVMEKAKEVDAIKKGVELTYNKLHSILKSKGLAPFVSVGEEFNSDIHEAISKMPAPDDKMKNKVVVEVEKGYMLNDQVIRFSKVIIGE